MTHNREIRKSTVLKESTIALKANLSNKKYSLFFYLNNDLIFLFLIIARLHSIFLQDHDEDLFGSLLAPVYAL